MKSMDSWCARTFRADFVLLPFFEHYLLKYFLIKPSRFFRRVKPIQVLFIARGESGNKTDKTH